MVRENHLIEDHAPTPIANRGMRRLADHKPFEIGWELKKLHFVIVTANVNECNC
jgi:hypothetical protein